MVDRLLMGTETLPTKRSEASLVLCHLYYGPQSQSVKKPFRCRVTLYARTFKCRWLMLWLVRYVGRLLCLTYIFALVTSLVLPDRQEVILCIARSVYTTLTRLYKLQSARDPHFVIIQYIAHTTTFGWYSNVGALPCRVDAFFFLVLLVHIAHLSCTAKRLMSKISRWERISIHQGSYCLALPAGPHSLCAISVQAAPWHQESRTRCHRIIERQGSTSNSYGWYWYYRQCVGKYMLLCVR